MATTKHVSFAGVTLPLASPQLEDVVRHLKPIDVFKDADFWNFDQPRILTERLPTPSLPLPPGIALGRLYWPTGASRPAWYHAVVNTQRLDQIRAAVGDPGTPRPLVLNDGRVGHGVTASMYLLPARPLNQLGHSTSDSWILTLTDQRFFWYFRRLTVSARPSSWASLYTQIGAALGISIAAEAVDAGYATPSNKWVGAYLPVSAVFDAVADTVGQRVVVQLDGTVSTVGWANAQTASNTQIDDSDLRVLMGGTLDTGDIRRYVPASINVLFQKTNAPPNNQAPTTVNKTLATLAITDYGSSTGMTGYAQVVWADLQDTGANASALAAYATIAATDFYGWRLEDVDVSLPGIQSWVMTGWEDCAEWTVQLRERTAWEVEAQASGDGIPKAFSSTVITRGPFSDVPSGYFPPRNNGNTPGNPTDGCGWMTGMRCDWCLTADVIFAGGECSDIADLNPNQFVLKGSGSPCSWTSQQWNCTGDVWETANFTYDTGAGPLVVTMDATTGLPVGTIDGHPLATSSCSEGSVVFTGGNNLYSGYCTGDLPDPCDPNTFQVFVQCSCCPISGWQGPGWYCICQSGSDCNTCDLIAVELLDEDMCDTGIVICSCRYATEEDASAVRTTSYNCSSGTCVPVSGSGGTYPTLSACQAVCGGGSGCDCDCCPTGFNDAFTFTVAGITGAGSPLPCTGDDATTCPQHNGTWTVRWRASCGWTTDEESPCNPGSPMYSLGCNGTDWFVTSPCAAGADVIRWACPVGSFGCSTGGTFSLSSAPCCDPVPSSITLTATGTFHGCP